MRQTEKYPIGDSEIEESIPNNLRLKVTDKCPWQCSFCHNEGGRFTTDIRWGPKLEEVLSALRKVIPNLSEVHYSGGEPTRNRELPAITAGLVAMGFEVKMTTNGQFTENDLDKLVLAGLESFNFSVHSLDPERFLSFQTGRSKNWIDEDKVSGSELPASKIKQVKMNRLDWAKDQIERQLSMILYAKEKGVDIKINTVISDRDGIKNARDIFNWSKEHNIPLRLLNDLGTGDRSIEAIRDFIESTGATEILRRITNGSSSCSTIYVTGDGYEFAFKQIRDFRLETVCRNCQRIVNKTCEEQFYGIRIQEGADGKFYVILCIQESNPQTQMTVEDFIRSPQLEEIISYLS
jgi:cyclic pyranopterin phosphate synthase